MKLIDIIGEDLQDEADALKLVARLSNHFGWCTYVVTRRDFSDEWIKQAAEEHEHGVDTEVRPLNDTEWDLIRTLPIYQKSMYDDEFTQTAIQDVVAQARGYFDPTQQITIDML